MGSKVINATNNINIEFLMDRCIGCGLCSKICGNSAIKMESGMPYIDTSHICCSCGHCAAICPKLAICSTEIDNDRSFKIKLFESDENVVERLLKNKRSVREFKNEIPSKNIIEKIVEFAEKAPSSNNNRHRKYFIITDNDKIAEIEKSVIGYFKLLGKVITPLLVSFSGIFSKKLSNELALIKADINHMTRAYGDGESPLYKNAPVLIFIAAPKGDVQAKDDCVIAQQYMMLYAESIGVGSCINGYTQVAHKSVDKLIDIPAGYVIYSAGVFGYSQYTYKNEIVYNNKPDAIFI